MKTDIDVSEADMDILRRGHIPDAMEDHWFMYCDDKAIRYYRSWTGMPAFEARYVKTNLGAKITSLKMNRELCQWGESAATIAVSPGSSIPVSDAANTAQAFDARSITAIIRLL